MWYKNAGTSFFHFVTKHARVWQRDGRTDRKAFAIPCVCITCSRTVKTTAPDRLGGNCPMDPPLAVSASSEVSPNLRRSFLSHSLSSLSLPDLILSWMPEPRSTVPASVDFAAVLFLSHMPWESNTHNDEINKLSYTSSAVLCNLSSHAYVISSLIFPWQKHIGC